MEVRKANSQHIINQLAQSCREKGINADNLIKQLNDEVNKQANSWIYADGEKLDKITDKIITLKKDYDKPSSISARISADLKGNNTSELKKHLSEITKDNVSDVVVSYKSKDIKSGIFSDIMKNNNIDTETKKGYIRDIAGKFAEHCREKGVKCDDILKDIEGELKQECLENNNGKRLDEIGIKPLGFVPVSGINGVNISAKSQETPWYEGKTLYEFLDVFKAKEHSAKRPFRMFLQDVYRFTESGDNRRIYAGTVNSGTLKSTAARLIL